MRRALAWSVVLGVLACSAEKSQRREEAPSPPPAAPVAPPPAPHAVVVTQPDANAPVVAVRLVFRTGSVDDPAGLEGLTALTASLMAEATAKKDAAALREALFPYATDVVFTVDAEATMFRMTVHRDVAHLAIPFLFDVVADPRMDPRDFERLRRDAVQDIQRRLRLEDDEALGHAALDAFLWRGHPYRRLPEGTVQALEKMTLEQLRAHRKRVFTQARVVAGLGGAYSPAVEALFRRGIERLPAGGAWSFPALPPTDAQEGLQVYIVEKDAVTTPVDLGFRFGLTRAHPDYVAMLVANSILGEHRQLTGRLFLRMREARGLNYGDYSYIEHFVQEGSTTLSLVNIPRREHAFRIWLRPVGAGDRVFALRQALRELRIFVEQGVSADELERARNFLLGYTRIAELGASRRIGHAIDDVINGTPAFRESLRAKLAELTVDEVNAAVRRHLRVDNAVVVMQARDAAALREQLLSGAPSPRAEEKVPAALREEDALISAYPLALSPSQVTIVPVAELFER